MPRFATIAASAACSLALLAGCGGPPRTIAITYEKAEATDVEAAQDKKQMQSMSGVHNVVLEHARDGSVRVQVYVLDGKEASVMPKVEELGYSRVR